MAASPPKPRRRALAFDPPTGPGDIALIEFGPARRPADVIFSHANGFNAGTYRSTLAPLAPEVRVTAPDSRGHGLTTLPANPSGRRNWQDLRDDLVALLERLDGPPVVLAGHSMGGTVSLLAAAAAPSRVRAVVCFDPVIWPTIGVLANQLPFAGKLTERHAPIARASARRRRRFDSREAAFRAYAGRGAFRTWPVEMVADYLEDGLRESPDGGVELSCTPEWETSNYTAQAHDPYAAIRAFGGRTLLLRASRASTCRIGEADRFMKRHPHTEVHTIGGGHFFPMERPDLVRAAIAAAVQNQPLRLK